MRQKVKLVGLGKQIALSMVTIAIGVSLIMFATSYVFFYLLEKYWPEYLPQEMSLIPTLPEVIWMMVITSVGVSMAAFFAYHLSKEILGPLNSLLISIKSVAEGDLSSRIELDDRCMKETSLLVDNFNGLVDKLKTAADEQHFWNAAIAHELRTPVTILQGRIQGLADGIFEPDKAQFDNLLNQVTRLSRIIEDLRVVSLSEHEHLAITPESTDIANELAHLVALCQPQFLVSGHTVSATYNHRFAWCDPQRFQQAMLALFDNITKHANSGPINIRTDKAGDFVTIEIEDAGPGIPEGEELTIFSAFRKASVNKRHNGSGLGLAVVAAIVQAHGGHVSYRRSLSGGSIFSLMLPATDNPLES